MTFSFSLQNVLKLKEHEKKEAEQKFSAATGDFEKAATGLYELLKQKEKLEEAYEHALAEGTTISRLNDVKNQIGFLESLIETSRKTTDRARMRMQTSRSKVSRKAADVLKYEKIRGIKLSDYKEEQKNREAKQLDDIALQQYLRK
ncbi:flagellar export protein FliJ [Alteribacter natronophilus]|uniref:flagellar export protein FliJ n=1 Tax=Alteribacter natronophilus TaxID=2583810 RepID=UPI001486AB3F|nr:flagellar export protein FliJ [Alteribacter natronophilus]